jgi:hypothetical protein
MTESTRRRVRWLAWASAAALALLLALALYLIYRGDSAIQQAANRLQPGMTTEEVRRILADVPHFDVVTRGSGQFLLDGDAGFINVKVENDRVTAVDRQPENGSVWERMRRSVDRLRRDVEWRLRRRA